MNVRRALAATVVAGLIVSLTACAPDVDTQWMPPQWPASSVSVSEIPEPLDPATVPLYAQRLRNDDLGLQARFSVPHGASALGDRVTELVRAAALDRAAVAGAAYTPVAMTPAASATADAAPAAAAAAAPGLADRDCVRGSTLLGADAVLGDPELAPAGGTGTAVMCDVTVASGDFLGLRMRVITATAAAATSDVTTGFFSNLRTGEVVTGEGLWTDAAANELWRDVVEALRRDAGSLSLAAVGTPTEQQHAQIEGALQTTSVAPDGSFVFTLAPGFETPELARMGIAATGEPMSIAVPVEALGALASPFGAALSAAVAEAVPAADPPVVPAGFEKVDCTLVPCAAITYDDGPSALTPTLLDVLRDTHSAATFFVIGQYAASNPDPVRRAAAEGHEIGVHTWNHPHLPELDDAAIASQITDTRTLLQSLSGQPVALFRPPYGEYNRRVLAAAGLPAFIWTVDTRDWAGPADDVLRASGVNEVKPGGIVLFHDTHERSVRLAPDIIAGLRDRGFTLVTLTQLFDGALPTSGAWSSAP